jgi:hypothetical protein
MADHTEILNTKLRAEGAQQKMLALMEELCSTARSLIFDHAPILNNVKDARLKSSLARLYSGLPYKEIEGENLKETLECIVEFWTQQEKLYRDG